MEYGIARLEQGTGERRRGRYSPRLFWPSDLEPCPAHIECDIEVASGEHHRNVIHLSWDQNR